MDDDRIPDAELVELNQEETAPRNPELEKQILSGPAMVAFVIPLMTPVGIVHGSTVNMQRDEVVPWSKMLSSESRKMDQNYPCKMPIIACHSSFGDRRGEMCW